MTPDFNYFDQVEDYCQGLLSNEAELQFEAELKMDAKLRNEVKLRKDINKALTERDVLTLRKKLKRVNQRTDPNSHNDSFDLLTNLTNLNEVANVHSFEDLMEHYDSMPKVHVHQHKVAEKETVHQFYKKQGKLAEEESDIDEFNFEEFDGIEEAILEKDILNLRHTLSEVAKSMEPRFGIEEIDGFLNNDLSQEQLAEFEEELRNSRELKSDIELHKEIEAALAENDVIDLRSRISRIIKTETSWNVSEQEIEDFIEGELDEGLLEVFNAELKENSDLLAEVKLRRQINETIGETDIRELRAKLNKAKDLAGENKTRRLIPAVSFKLNSFIRTSVAVVVLLIAIGGVFSSGYFSVQNTYNKFFKLPEWSAERSVSTNVTLLQKAQHAFANGEYSEVVKLLDGSDELSSNNPVFRFYAGASWQEMGKLKQAIHDYTKVIKNGNNLFVEEAEWYRSLCYLRLGKKIEAEQELLAIINKQGYFEEDAKAVLRRLKLVPE